MRKDIFKILKKKYIKRIFEKKKDLYFPSFKNKKIIRLEIKKESPDWAENSCLVRYKIIFSDSRSKILRATAHIDGSKKRAFKIMKYLCQRDFDGDFFRIPKPLDYLEETKTLLYEEVKGEPLSLLLEKKRPPSIALNFEKLAEFLYRLHSIKDIKMKVRIFGLSEYERIFWQIKKILPAFSILIPPLKKITFLKKLKEGSAFLHGDFYPSNIVLKGNKIALLDFDKAGRGSFFVDLLPFIYSFDLPKIKPLKLSSREIEELKDIFLKTYCRFSKLDFFKTKRDLDKFRVKIFLDCLHYVTVLAYHGWKRIDKRLKSQFAESIKILLKKINKFL